MASGGEAADAPVSLTRIPDIRVRDQNGRRLKFYSDLVKDRTVAINLFTTARRSARP